MTVDDPTGTPLAPPSYAQRGRELLLGRDLARLAVRTPALLGQRATIRRPALLVAGFGATELSLFPLMSYLRRLGHDARPARLGRVSDDVEGLAPHVAEVAAELAAEVGEPVTMIGWSIGGVMSREAARERPDVIRRVITFGSPVVGGPSFTALAGRYTDERLAAIREAIAERNEIPIGVPVTAIWSANDGIVTPAACIDGFSPDVENIEVTSTHIGLGLDPNVWTVVADRLARD